MVFQSVWFGTSYEYRSPLLTPARLSSPKTITRATAFCSATEPLLILNVKFGRLVRRGLLISAAHPGGCGRRRGDHPRTPPPGHRSLQAESTSQPRCSRSEGARPLGDRSRKKEGSYSSRFFPLSQLDCVSHNQIALQQSNPAKWCHLLNSLRSPALSVLCSLRCNFPILQTRPRGRVLRKTTHLP